jgi:hypothetical protein
MIALARERNTDSGTSRVSTGAVVGVLSHSSSYAMNRRSLVNSNDDEYLLVAGVACGGAILPLAPS